MVPAFDARAIDAGWRQESAARRQLGPILRAKGLPSQKGWNARVKVS